MEFFCEGRPAVGQKKMEKIYYFISRVDRNFQWVGGGLRGLSLQELSKPMLATPLHADVLVTYLLSYLGTYLFTRLLTRYKLQPLLYKLSNTVLI